MDDTAPNAAPETESEALSSTIAVRAAAGLAGLKSLGWVIVPLTLGLASRVFSATLIATAGSLASARHHPALLTSLRSPFLAWDGQWYLSVATRGYHALPLQAHARHDLAFFPGWPLLIRIATFGIEPASLVAPILANVLAILAFIAIWRLFAGRFGEEVATNGTLLLAFSPAAFVMSMAYSEPLYLLVTALAFLAGSGRGRAWLTAAAMLVRVGGVALIAATGIEWLLDRGRSRWRLVAVVAGVAALLGWMAVVALVSHDPFGFLHDGSSDWANPSGYHAIAIALRHPTLGLMVRFVFYASVVLGALAVLRCDRELGLFALVTLALAVLPGALITSYPRYALAAFPAMAGLALLLGHRRVRAFGRNAAPVLAIAFGAFQVYLVGQAFLVSRLWAP